MMAVQFPKCADNSILESIEEILKISSSWVTAITIFGFLATLLNFVLIIIKMYLISDVLNVGSYESTRAISSIWLLVYLCLALLGLLQSAAASRLSRYVSDRLTTPALLAVAEHARGGTANLHEVLRDTETVRECVSSFAGKMLVSMAMTPILLPLTFIIHWMLAVIVLSFCLAMALVSLMMVRTLNRQHRLIATDAANIFGMTVDTMRSGEAVLAMGMLQHLAKSLFEKVVAQGAWA